MISNSDPPDTSMSAEELAREAAIGQPDWTTTEADDPATNEIISTLDLCEIRDIRRRLIAVFLGTTSTASVFRQYDHLMGLMLMECFLDFVYESGGRVVRTTRVTDLDEIGNPGYLDLAIMATCEHTDETERVDARRTVLTDGMHFVLMHDERFVVEIRPLEDKKVISIVACQQMHDLRQRWLQFCKQRSYLRGKAFLPNGELLYWAPPPTWADVTLPERVCRMLIRHSLEFFRSHVQLGALGGKTHRGLLLEGPPGSGKTLLAKIVAVASGATVLWVTPRFIGDSGDVAAIMRIARFLSPTLLVLEDVDLFGEDREHAANSPLGELMNQLDGAVENEAVLTLATTNRLALVEQALRNRPGRFDRVIHIGALDPPCRESLLRKLTRRCPLAEEDLADLVQASDGFTGAQLEELVNTMMLEALAQPAPRMASAMPGPRSQDRSPLHITRAMIQCALEEMGPHIRQEKIGFAAEEG